MGVRNECVIRVFEVVNSRAFLNYKRYTPALDCSTCHTVKHLDLQLYLTRQDFGAPSPNFQSSVEIRIRTQNHASDVMDKLISIFSDHTLFVHDNDNFI
eukprot:COSAG02_NODE_3918_length_6048_cov_3.708186_4_plen_99_part_00